MVYLVGLHHQLIFLTTQSRYKKVFLLLSRVLKEVKAQKLRSKVGQGTRTILIFKKVFHLFWTDGKHNKKSAPSQKQN